LKHIDSKPNNLRWVKSVVPLWKSVFSSQLCIIDILIEMYGSHWLEKNVLLNKEFEWFAIRVFKVNDTVRHLPHQFLPFVYMLEWSLSNLPTADNTASNFAEEWRFHINWNVVSPVEQNSVTWNNYHWARLAIPNHAFMNSQKRWSCRYAMS